MTPGQFGPIEPASCEPPSARFTVTMSSTGMPSVMQTISGTPGVDRLEDRVGGEGRRHVDRRRGGAGLARPPRATVSNTGRSRCLRAAFAGRDAADHLGAVGDRLLGMERALGAGEALADDLGLGIDEDRHQAASFTAVTTFSAASARLSAERIGRPDSREDLLAELDIGAFEPHDQRHVQADLARRGDDALGDHVAAHDAAEDVDEDAFDVRVGEDELERRR